jgi:hypothetical protein
MVVVGASVVGTVVVGASVVGTEVVVGSVLSAEMQSGLTQVCARVVEVVEAIAVDVVEVDPPMPASETNPRLRVESTINHFRSLRPTTPPQQVWWASARVFGGRVTPTFGVLVIDRTLHGSTKIVHSPGYVTN